MNVKRKFVSWITVLILVLLTCSCGMSEAVDEPGDVPDDNTENIQEKTYSIEDYGVVEEGRKEFFNDDDSTAVYYYKMENFLFHDNFPNADLINRTLQQVYDGKEKEYIETAEVYSSEDESFDTPYSYWHVISLEYVGDDYISIMYNDVYYMGGAHPYSYLDGITIDCKTGEQVSASQLIEKSDGEILAEVSDLMGLDVMGTWEDIDFYITDSTIVFFYRMPGFWEDVVLQREK